MEQHANDILRQQIDRILEQHMLITFNTSGSVWRCPVQCILPLVTGDPAVSSAWDTKDPRHFLLGDLTGRLGTTVTDDDIKDTLLECASEIPWESLKVFAMCVTPCTEDEDDADEWDADDWSGADFPTVAWQT